MSILSYEVLLRKIYHGYEIHTWNTCGINSSGWKMERNLSCHRSESFSTFRIAWETKQKGDVAFGSCWLSGVRCACAGKGGVFVKAQMWWQGSSSAYGVWPPNEMNWGMLVGHCKSQYESSACSAIVRNSCLGPKAEFKACGKLCNES